jgi:hypothetical protein
MAENQWIKYFIIHLTIIEKISNLITISKIKFFIYFVKIKTFKIISIYRGK